MHDFEEGKVTIPYLLLHERLENKEALVSLYKKPLDDKNITWIKNQMIETKALKDSILMAKKLGNEAIEALKDENSMDLVLIMKAMIERDF